MVEKELIEDQRAQLVKILEKPLCQVSLECLPVNLGYKFGGLV